MRKCGLARLLTAAIALLMLVQIIPFATESFVRAEDDYEERFISHAINVVYDDSNSMLLDGRLWWCYAKYSLEVFSAMMQSKDTMSVYYMSDGDSSPRITGLLGSKNKQQENIETIHNTVTKTYGTPFESIERAYEDLKKTSSSFDEKWLMVITDGDSFNGKESTADLDKLFSDCEAYNIRVVYLAIGNALVPTEKTAGGIYVYKADGQDASGNTGILARVTQVCQRIFQRPAVSGANASTLKLDIPVSEIIVFAQGTNVRVGDIADTVKTVSTVKMSSNDKDKATTNSSYINSINIASLNASIVTIMPSNGNFIKEGVYDLPITADEYVVYYKPCLDVVLKLFDSEGNRMTEKYIPVGSYKLEYWLTYPAGHEKNGEKIAQSLFDVNYTLSCSCDGEKRILNSNNVDLDEGDTVISVLAEYLNFSSSDASYKCVVENFTIDKLDLELEYNQKEYRLSTLQTQNEGIAVKVTKNGAAIPAEEWERFELKADIDNPDFKVVKNSDSTFTVYPQYKDGAVENTASGDIVFDINVSAANDHRTTDSGTARASINIYDDVTAVTIGIAIDEQKTKCDNKNFPTQDTDRKVTIDWAGNPLTKEQYDSLKLSAEINDADFTVTIETNPFVEGELTTATLHFDVVRDASGEIPAPKHLYGVKEVTVNAVVENDGNTSTGSKTGTLAVDDARTLWEIILDILWLIIALLALLFLILAYAPIIKRYLPSKCKYMAGGFSNTVKLYKSPKAVLTTILPFVRVCSSVPVRGRTEDLVLDIRARGGKRAVCTNAKQLAKNNIMLDGRLCKKSQSVNLTSLRIDKNGRNIASFCRTR